LSTREYSPTSPVQPAYNARLTEINFIEAAKEAEKLDEHLKKTGQVVGPLHGVPISLKASPESGMR
jgi:amidase